MEDQRRRAEKVVACDRPVRVAGGRQGGYGDNRPIRNIRGYGLAWEDWTRWPNRYVKERLGLAVGQMQCVATGRSADAWPTDMKTRLGRKTDGACVAAWAGMEGREGERGARRISSASSRSREKREQETEWNRPAQCAPRQPI